MKYVGTARILDDEDGDAVKTYFKDDTGDVRRHRGDPMGEHDALTLVFFGRNFEGGDVKIVKVSGGE